MKYNYGGLNIDALSVGGQYTSILIQNHRMAIDMGICSDAAIRCDKVFFTHAHADHMAGVIRHCSSREMMHMAPPTYYMGAENTDAFEKMLVQWRRLNHSKMPCKVVAMTPGESVSIHPKWNVSAFRSVHRVPCQGYLLSEKRKKLKEAFKGLSSNEISAIRKKGEEVVSVESIPIAAYTGDSTLDVLTLNPILQRVKLLIIELTFVNDAVSSESARKHGHIHIEDIEADCQLFQNERILLMHLSARHDRQTALDELNKRLPKDLMSRIDVLGNRSIFKTDKAEK